MLVIALALSLAVPQNPPQEPERKARDLDAVPQLQTDPTAAPIEFETSGRPSDGEFFVAPIPLYNPTLGIGLTLAAGYFFPPEAKGSPPSMIGGGIFYSDSGSWFVGVGGRFHLDEDRWRLSVGGGGGRLNYDFSGIGTTDGDEHQDIPLSVHAGGGQAELLRQIVPGLYGGLRLRFGRVRTDVDPDDELGPIGSLIPEEAKESNTAAVGINFEWDTRDLTFFPSDGTYATVRLDFHPEELGEFEYQVYDVAWNRFLAVAPDHILALRARGRLAKGDVPYYGLSYLGVGADLRGYTIGRYQDKLLLAAQAEWRWGFAERWVAVGFAGLGQVAPGFDDLSGDDLLPSLGLGLRFTLAPENKVSLRVDAAAGKDDYAFYLGVAEAF